MTINDTREIVPPSLDPASGGQPQVGGHVPFAGRSIAVGVIATVGLASFYVVVLSLLGGPGHLGEQISQDAVWVVLLTVGFGAAIVWRSRRAPPSAPLAVPVRWAWWRAAHTTSPSSPHSWARPESR
jgi:hypothetical protein